MSNEQLVERYMTACTNADKQELLEVLAEDAIHYFLPREMEPVRGAEQIAELWLDVQSIQPRWSIDNLVAEGDQVVVEYTTTYHPDGPNLSSARLSRGCEWYRIEAGKIKEIRAYFESDYSQDRGLTGYPYEAMGYTTKDDDA